MAALVAVAAVVLLAGTVQGATGFGFSLVAVPLLALAVGARDAVVLAALLAVASTSVMAVRLRRRTDRAVAGRLLGGAVVGLPVGAVALASVPDRMLLAAIAVGVGASVLLMVRPARRAAPGTVGSPAPVGDVVAGVLCGLLTTSVGTNGPPVVLRLQARGLSAGTFRATTSTVFAGCNAVAVAVFAAGGLLDATTLRRAAVAVVPLGVGLVMGDAVHRRLPAERFRGLVLGLLVLTAVVALAGAVR